MIQFKLSNNGNNDKKTQENTAQPELKTDTQNATPEADSGFKFVAPKAEEKTEQKPAEKKEQGDNAGGFKFVTNNNQKEESDIKEDAPANAVKPQLATAAATTSGNQTVGATLADLNPESGSDSVSIHIGQEEEVKKEEDKKKKKKFNLKSIYGSVNEFLVQATPIKTKEITTFFRLMATMQNAGITLLKAIKIMVNQTPNLRFQKVLGEFSSKIEEGSNFSDCLRDYPQVFDESTVGMIASGEASGRLSHVLVDIANMMEKSQKLKSKIKGAMIYPVTVMIVLFLVGIVVMVMIVPKFVELFDQLEGELPTSTALLIGLSNFLQSYWWLVLMAPFALLLAIHQFKKTEYGRMRWDWLMLRVPIFGMLNRKVALSRFTGNLASMSEAGISIVKALQINADSIGNHVYRDRILQIRDDVEQGIPIAENIKNNTFLFPDLVVSMIDVGEQTATITQVCRKVAEFYDQEIDATVKNLTTAMEPIIIVVLASAVGGLVAAIMQPIFMMSDLATNA